MKLKQLLSIEELANSPDPTAQFKEIAEQLFNNYCIKKGDKIYEFVEIEFYLYTPQHKDIITYPRCVRLGDWLFHESGIDICFGYQHDSDFHRKDISEMIPIKEDACFGGILIRSIRLTNQNTPSGYKYYCGPWNCADELFDQFSSFKPQNNDFEYPYIVQKGLKHKDEFKVCQRRIKLKDYKSRCKSILNNKFGLDCNEVEQESFKGFLEKKYRYYLDVFVKEKENDKNIKKYGESTPSINYENFPNK